MNKRWEEEGRGEREGDGKEERGKEEGEEMVTIMKEKPVLRTLKGIGL